MKCGVSRLQQPRPKAAVCENAETWPFGNVFLLGGQDAWVCKSQFIADRLMVPDGPNGHLLHAVRPMGACPGRTTRTMFTPSTWTSMPAHLERANGHKTMSNLMYLRKAIVVTNQQRKAHIHTNSTVHHNHNCQSVQVKQKQSKNIRASWRLIGILDG